jgi:hypothetical protein
MSEQKEGEALKPCPFCGGEAGISSHMDESIWSHNIVPWTKVECSECEIGTPYRCKGWEPTPEEEWNTRSPAAQKEGEAVPDGVQAPEPVREALTQLVAVLREYGTFPPNVVPALIAAEKALAAVLEDEPQPTLDGIEAVEAADNQWFGDMMVLQVLADSDNVNEQEREVLTRWMAASDRPSQQRTAGLPASPAVDLTRPHWRCVCGAVAMPLTDDTRCNCADIYDQQWTRVDPPGVTPCAAPNDADKILRRLVTWDDQGMPRLGAPDTLRAVIEAARAHLSGVPEVDGGQQ